MKIVICRPGKWVWRVNFDGGDVEEHVDVSHSKNGFTWPQTISGGNVEEHVDFRNTKIASLGFKTFRGGDVDKVAMFKGYNCIHRGSQIAVKFTQLQSVEVPV